MLKALCIASLSLVVIDSTSIALAAPLAQPPKTGIESVPNPRRTYGGWVSDTAHLLSPQSQADLDRIISELEAKNGSEVAVVTVPDTAASASPKAFANKLFNTWGIGKRDKNNGVLVLISRKDRRVEVETGSGLNDRLPNDRVQQIIQQEMIPPFKQEKFDAGTIAGTRAIVEELAKPTFPWNLYPTTTITFAAIAVWFAWIFGSRQGNKAKRPGRTERSSSSSSSTSSNYGSSNKANGTERSSSSSSSTSSDYGCSSSSSSDFGGGSSSGGGGGDSW